MICSKAPGKIILFGEHFVVRGFPGIGTAVSSYARVCVEESSRTFLESKQLGLVYDEVRGVGIGSGFETLIREIRDLGCSRSFKAAIDSSIFISSGMGSSAAVSVALAHALLRFCNIEPSKELVSKIAFESEKKVHGRPSGIDNTLATYGGLVYYRAGSFKRISVEWPDEYSFLVVNSGIERDTGSVVRDVLELYERRREILDHIYRSAEVLVEEALKMIHERDFKSLGELMNINQGLLYAINTSCHVCEDIIWILRRSGALGAKISGAGRGGIVIALFKSHDLKNAIKIISERGLNYLVVKPDELGVRESEQPSYNPEE